MANKNYDLTISSSPHIHSPITTHIIMRDVLIALLPALIGSVYFFGFRALTVTLVSVASCIFFELAWCVLRRQRITVTDLSCVVTGVLLAFICPVTIPYWTIVIGAFFSIIVVKMLFGGIGLNVVNPALAGRAFMFSWPVLMATWVKVGYGNAAAIINPVDAVTAATPLAVKGQMAADVSLMDLFLGNVGGCIGETSALLLLIGLVYLLARRVITLHIPLAYIGTVAVLTFLFPRGNDNLTWMVYQLCGGGLMLGAIFMATDYVTSPVTRLGQVFFGIGCGVITVVIRYFGGYPEGVSYAILVMNCSVVLFDRIGRNVRYGAPKKEGTKK